MQKLKRGNNNEKNKTNSQHSAFNYYVINHIAYKLNGDS